MRSLLSIELRCTVNSRFCLGVEKYLSLSLFVFGDGVLDFIVLGLFQNTTIHPRRSFDTVAMAGDAA